MRRFTLGFLVAIVISAIAVFSFLRFGMMDPRADMPVNAMERGMAMPSLDASIARRAPELANPVAPTDENLIAGMKVYQNNCALCHGDIHQHHAKLAETLYPRPPQFVEDSADMPPNQNFYIIQHGIRMSGMPGWKDALSPQEMWQVTGFLSHMDSLSPAVANNWKVTAGGSASDPDIKPGDSDTEKKSGMKM